MAMLEINLRPSTRELRQFGFIALAGFGLLAAVVYWRHGLFGFDFGRSAGTVAATLGALGGLSALLSLVFPAANRPLYVALVVCTYPIGLVVSNVLLALFFYGLLTPVGLLFRLLGRDALHRKLDPQASTYWVSHHTPDTMHRYFRQF